MKALAMVALALATQACRPSEYAYQITRGGAQIANCPRAIVKDLTPAGGGFELVCHSGDQAYFINDTHDGNGKYLSEILLKAGSKEDELVPAGATPPRDCPGATRIEAIPARTLGSWQLALARPCERVDLVIAPAR